jgi:NitT/TauT family transport system permease protein
MVLVGWEAIKAATHVPRAVLPHVWEIAAFLGSIDSHGNLFAIYLAQNMVVTFREAMLGLVVGATSGLLLGTLIALSQRVGRGVLPFIIAAQTVPMVAVAPAIVIWLGTGEATKALIAGFLSFFPVTVTTARGLSDVPGESVALMHTYGASVRQKLFALRYPSALPMIFTGLEAAAAFAVLGSLVGELPVGSSAGMGVVILTSWQFYTFQPESLYNAVAATFAVGIAVVSLVKMLERVILRHRRKRANDV